MRGENSLLRTEFDGLTPARGGLGKREISDTVGAMTNLVQRTIESLHAEDACPRLHINLLAEDTVCPDFVVEKWKEELVIDLDPSYPLELEFTDTGVEANLSFGGFVTRCVFPYAGIYFVGNKATGRGVVLDENMPDSIRVQRQSQILVQREGPSTGKSGREGGESRRKRRKKDGEGEATQVEKATGPMLASVPSLVDDEDSADPTTDDVTEAETDISATQTEDDSDSEPESKPDSEPAAPSSEAKSKDEEVKKRRSAFRVIEGGD